jgi:hypothetical protein
VRDKRSAPSAEIEEELIYRIGSVAVTASRMELIAAGVYVKLLGGGQAAELIAYGQNWATVSRSCQVILEHQNEPETSEPLKALFKRADAAYEQRSRIIHGFWIAAVGACGDRYSVVPKRYGKRDTSQWNAEQLEAVRDELSHIGTEMMRLAGALPVVPDAATRDGI